MISAVNHTSFIASKILSFTDLYGLSINIITKYMICMNQNIPTDCIASMSLQTIKNIASTILRTKTNDEYNLALCLVLRPMYSSLKY